MTGITVQVFDTASGALSNLAVEIAPERLNKNIAVAAHNLVRRHLDEKESEPNKSGFPTRNYYAEASASTHWRADAAGATVSITQVGFALRYFGGDVLPGKNISEFTGQPTKYLTIPARSESSGKKASEFGNLKVLWGRNGPYALAAGEGGAHHRRFDGREDTVPARKIKGLEQGVIVYWLVKKAHQEADPTVLPDQAQFEVTIAKVVQSVVGGIGGQK